MLKLACRSFLAGAAFILAACGGGGNTQPGIVPLSLETDIPYGKADAPITLIEYAALTCGGCGNFNNTVLSEIKPKYIDTGKVRLITREAIYVPPAEVNLAGFALARCAGPDKHHAVIDDIFQNQAGLISTIRAGGTNQFLQAVASRHGVDKEAYEACIADQEMKESILGVSELAQNLGFATPTLILNGRKLEGNTVYTAEGLAELLDAELAKSE